MTDELYLAKPCEECGGPLTEQRHVYPGGPVKKYCSSRCRHRAWRERDRDRDLSAEAIEYQFQAAKQHQRRVA